MVSVAGNTPDPRLFKEGLGEISERTDGPLLGLFQLLHHAVLLHAFMAFHDAS
jgi:hypothetical protein